jgi:hypothetical protein
VRQNRLKPSVEAMICVPLVTVSDSNVTYISCVAESQITCRMACYLIDLSYITNFLHHL